MSKRIYVDGKLLTEKQTLILAREVSKKEKNIETLNELERYMDDYSYEIDDTIPNQPQINFINQKYYGPHYRINAN